MKKNPTQLVYYYYPGVGAHPHDELVFSIFRKLKTWSVFALGTRLKDNVTQAYSYLMEFYKEGDDIFLFGFSRGAYTVGVLSGLIKEMGCGTRNVST